MNLQIVISHLNNDDNNRLNGKLLVLSIEHFRDLCPAPLLLRVTIHPAKFLAERNSGLAVVNSQDSKQREAAKWHSGLMTHYSGSPWETYGLNSVIVHKWKLVDQSWSLVDSCPCLIPPQMLS